MPSPSQVPRPSCTSIVSWGTWLALSPLLFLNIPEWHKCLWSWLQCSNKLEGLTKKKKVFQCVHQVWQISIICGVHQPRRRAPPQYREPIWNAWMKYMYGKILEPRESQMLLLFASDCGQSWGKGTAGTIPSPFLRCRLTNRGNQGAGSWWTTPAHTNVPMWETVSVKTNHGNQPAASCRRPNF